VIIQIVGIGCLMVFPDIATYLPELLF